jgi:hypothetical protein
LSSIPVLISTTYDGLVVIICGPIGVTIVSGSLLTITDCETADAIDIVDNGESGLSVLTVLSAFNGLNGDTGVTDNGVSGDKTVVVL